MRMATDPVARFDRIKGSKYQVSIDVLGADAAPVASLMQVNPDITITVNGTQVTASQGSDKGHFDIVVEPFDLKPFRPGLATLQVRVGSRLMSPLWPARIVTPPLWTMLMPSLYADANKESASAVQIGPIGAGAQASLLVREKHKPIATSYARLAKYDLNKVDYSLVRDDNFTSTYAFQPPESLLTLSRYAVLNQQTGGVQGLPLGAGAPITPLALTLNGPFVQLCGATDQTVGWISGGSQVTAFTLDAPTGGTPMFAPMAGTPIDLGMPASKYLLAARSSASQPGPQIDAVAVAPETGDVAVLRYDASSSSYIKDSVLSRNATTALMGSNAPAAVALHDVDLDGLTDLVWATQETPSQVYWSALKDDQTFTPPQPTGIAVADVISIAVGDLSGDGLPDLALATYGTKAGMPVSSLVVCRNAVRLP